MKFRYYIRGFGAGLIVAAAVSFNCRYDRKE